MVNLSSCRYGLPVFASLPHYYGADPVYLDTVEGLHPDRNKHEVYLIIEPVRCRYNSSNSSSPSVLKHKSS